MSVIFQKKGKEGKNVWKFRQKFRKFGNIFKKSSWMQAIIARNKLLEKVLYTLRKLEITSQYYVSKIHMGDHSFNRDFAMYIIRRNHPSAKKNIHIKIKNMLFNFCLYWSKLNEHILNIMDTQIKYLFSSLQENLWHF